MKLNEIILLLIAEIITGIIIGCIITALLVSNPLAIEIILLISLLEVSLFYFLNKYPIYYNIIDKKIEGEICKLKKLLAKKIK